MTELVSCTGAAVAEARGQFGNLHETECQLLGKWKLLPTWPLELE
jgi:hypothetical protein